MDRFNASRDAFTEAKRVDYPAPVEDIVRRSADQQNFSKASFDSQSGFAWIITSDSTFSSQRKIIVWNYFSRPLLSSKLGPSEIFVFSFPNSAQDSALSSKHVSIVLTESSGSENTGIITISQEGNVRLWPKLSNPSSFLDTQISLLDGEQCLEIHSIHHQYRHLIVTSFGRIITLSFYGKNGATNQKEITKNASLLQKMGSWIGLGSRSKIKIEDIPEAVFGLKWYGVEDGGIHVWHFTNRFLKVWYMNFASAQPHSHISSNANTISNPSLQNFKEVLLMEFDLVSNFASHFEASQQSPHPVTYTIFGFEVRSPMLKSNEDSFDQQKVEPSPPAITILAEASSIENDDGSTQIEPTDQDPSRFQSVQLATWTANPTNNSQQQISLSLLSIQSLPLEFVPYILSDPFTLLISPPQSSATFIVASGQLLSTQIPKDQNELNGIGAQILDLECSPYEILGMGIIEKSDTGIIFTSSRGMIEVNQPHALDWISASNLDSSSSSYSYRTQHPEELNVINQHHIGRAIPTEISTIHQMDISEPKPSRLSQHPHQHINVSNNYSTNPEFLLSEAFRRYREDERVGFSSAPWKSLLKQLENYNCQSTIEQFAIHIIDQSTNEDPRWPKRALSTQSNSTAFVSAFKRSLEIHQQGISSKMEEFYSFLEFLDSNGMLEGLDSSTICSLISSGEKLSSAEALRLNLEKYIQSYETSSSSSKSSKDSNLTPLQLAQTWMQISITENSSHSNQELRHQLSIGFDSQDVFLTSLSTIGNIIEVISKDLPNKISNSKLSSEKLQIVSTANSFFEAIFVTSLTYRSNIMKEFPILNQYFHINDGPNDKNASYLILNVPFWTWNLNPHLLEQIRRTQSMISLLEPKSSSNSSSSFSSHQQATPSQSSRPPQNPDIANLYSQLYHLSNCLLTDWGQEISRNKIIRNNSQDQSHGQHLEALLSQFFGLLNELISPFKNSEWLHDEALKLAELHHDFNTAIYICELRNDMDTLWALASRFEDQGFLEELFEFYFSNRLLYKLMTIPSIYKLKLLDYLNKDPQRMHLAWMQQIAVGKYSQAEITLSKMAASDPQQAMVYSSLSKLCQLVSPSE